MDWVNFFKVTKRSLLALGGPATGLLGLSLVLTIAGQETFKKKHEHTRGQIWAVEREMLMKRPTLNEMNHDIGSDGNKVTNSGTAVYVWHDLSLPDVVIAGTFADDGRLSYFKRVAHPKWRWGTGTYSPLAKKWEYSESKEER
jgi:hypothetical protein